MELKQLHRNTLSMLKKLLIVPYGIETRSDGSEYIDIRLLIVPYGIETFLYWMDRVKDFLLIVPYGIETNHVCS